jgi:hypothetical protein
MRRFLCFWWLCTKRAFKGSAAFANSWQWLIGIPAITGLAGYFAALQEKLGLSSGHPIADGVLAALGAFIVTWLVGFLARLLNAPAALLEQERQRADSLQDQAASATQPHREGIFSKTAREALEQKSRIAFGLEINPNALRISVGNDPPFSRARWRGLHGRERTLHLKAENTDKRRAISGCKIQLLNIEPAEHHGPWLLKADFTLAAGDEIFVPLVSYGEPWESTISGDSFMRICAPDPAPKPSASGQHILTLRATSLETAPHEIRCKLWVDAEQRLRIQETPNV